jgi:exosortase A
MSDRVDVIETAAEQSVKGTPANAFAKTATADRGRRLVAILSIYCLLVSLVFRDTLISMVSVWSNSETYAHGFLIPPICLFLAWRMRDRFSALTVRPEPWVLLLLLAAGLAWLLGDLVDVQLVQRLAYVAILTGGIWAIAGTAVARCFAFPLGFLFLAVPMGSGLILPLMIFTADTTEFMLRATGIPVYREALYLYLPTGTWSVVEECSGVRYVIASVTLGLCYAHLNYTSVWRKVAFVAAAVVVPILANSLRAYAVVMIGHLSDMRYGTGFDHLVFGWVMFGVVMMLMFWIGSYWQQDEASLSDLSGPAAPAQTLPALSVSVFAGLALVCASIWPVVAVAMYRNNHTIETLALTVPVAESDWIASDAEDWGWRPPQPGANRELDQVYVRGSDASAAIVGLHLRQYLQQEQGAELVENFNPWRPDLRVWQVRDQQNNIINLGQTVTVAEAWVSSESENLLVWSWYWIDGFNTSNPYVVKLLEAKQQLLEGRRQGTRVFIATPLTSDRRQARQVLQSFVNASFPAIKASLDSGIGAQGSAASLTSPEESVK